MKSDQLALFLHVARTGNLSRSALETGYSQSSLSRRIAALEAHLHTRLFYRSGRGVALTESGQRLERYAAEISGLLEAAERDISESAKRGPSRIVIAAPPTIARLTFGTLGHTLKRKYSGIKVQFKEGLGGDIQEWLAQGQIDAAITYLPERHPFIKADLLLTDRLNLIAPLHFRLRESFLIEQLSTVPLVLPSLPNSLRVLLDSLMARYSKALNVSMECDASVAILKQLVIEGCGCTVLPMASVHEDVSHGLLRAVPLVPDVFREVAIVTPRNRSPMLHQRQVIETVRKSIIGLVKGGHWVGAALVK